MFENDTVSFDTVLYYIERIIGIIARLLSMLTGGNSETTAPETTTVAETTTAAK